MSGLGDAVATLKGYAWERPGGWGVSAADAECDARAYETIVYLHGVLFAATADARGFEALAVCIAASIGASEGRVGVKRARALFN